MTTRNPDTLTPAETEGKAEQTPQWWTLRQAARQTGRSEKTIRRAVLKGKVVFQQRAGDPRAPYFVEAASVLEYFTPKAPARPEPVTAGKEMVSLEDYQRLQVERDQYLHQLGQAEGEAEALRRQLEAIEVDRAELDRVREAAAKAETELRERLARVEAVLGWSGRRRLRRLEPPGK